MRRNRQNIFDVNRRMADQINEDARNVIEQQEAQIQALQARIEQMAAAQQQIAAAQQQVQQNHFILTAEQFLNYVNKLRQFNGKDEFTVQEFINAVERTFQLCPNAPGLRAYTMGIVTNDKIQGEAKRCIQRLGIQAQNRWEDVKRELKLHFRPRQDYAELLNQGRSLRVSTLRELFENIREINYKLNELYEFDEARPPTYHPSNNDKYLVDIVSSKIHDFLRGNIPENATVIEVYNKFDKLKLLHNEDAVDFRSKKYKTNPNRNYNVNKNENLNKGNANNNVSDSNKNSSHPITNHAPNYRNNNRNNNNNNSRINDMSNHRKNFHNNNYTHNNSGQYRNRNANYNSYQPRQNSVQIRNNSIPEPMEIGNLNEDQDVNFQNEPRNLESL